MIHRTLGSSGIQVSTLALGSWRTYERISREAGVAVMRAAMEAGIDFLDDARYNDETGAAPLKTGYSEVVFGELFRAAGWDRDRVVLANKLWWEFWPREDALAEIEGSLGRMGLDHVDLIYAEQPPEDLPLDELVRQVGAVLKSGKARTWGVLNWTPAQLAEASRAAASEGVVQPCAAQLAYSVAMRSMVESAEMGSALDTTGASVVASFSLLGGVLTGKYLEPGAYGRWSGELEDPRLVAGRQAAIDLRALAQRTGTTAAALAIAFPLFNQRVSSVLFGATNPDQLQSNLEALQLLDGLTAEERETLLSIE